MTDRQKTSRVRLLAALLAALILCTLLSMPALAQGAGAEDTGESSSFVESTSDFSLMESEKEPSELEGSTVEEALEEKAGVDGPEEQTRASAAGAGLLDTLPTQVSDYSEFDAALSQIILDGSGHIELVNSISLPDTIEIPAGVSLTLSGVSGSEKITMAAGVDNTRHFHVMGDAQDKAELTLANIVIDGETRTGGIFVENGHIELLAGTIMQYCYRQQLSNAPTGAPNDTHGGGALALNDNASGVMQADVILGGNRFINWTATNGAGGGAVYLRSASATFTMEGGTIVSNQAGSNPAATWFHVGGGVYVMLGKFTMNDGKITGNVAFDNGGGVYLQGIGSSSLATFEMNGGSLTDNLAGSSGGAIGTYYNSVLDIGPGTSITGNEAYYNGGGLYLSGRVALSIDGSRIAGNFTSQSASGLYGGGAIYIASNTHPINIRNTVFEENYSENALGGKGGAIYLRTLVEVTVENCRFIGNTAPHEGGAIYLTDTLAVYQNLLVQNCYFAGNTSALGPYEFVLGDTDYETLHDTNIDVTGLSSPFDHTWAAEPRYNKAYNNFDISYPNGSAFSVYEVKFLVDGAEVGCEYAINGQPVRELAHYTPPTGQVVDGWYTDATYTTKWVFSDVVSGNMVLYGRLAPAPSTNHTLTVQYYFGLTLAAAVYIDEVDFAIPDGDDPALYLPAGWQDTHRPPAGYAAGVLADPPTLPGTVITDTTLKVLYIPDEYYVTFDFSQVFDAPADIRVAAVYYNELVPVQNTAKSGYTFKGWWYAAENRYWSLAQDRMPADDITLVGHWTKNTTPPPVTPSESSTSTGGGGESSNPPTTSSSTAPSTSRPASSSGIPASTSLASSSGPSSSAASEPVASPGPDDELDNRNISGTNLPLNWWQRGDGWSLLNLLVSILLLLSAAFQLVRMALARRRREDGYGDEGVQGKRRLWTILSAITGIPPILLLFLLEDFAGAMLLLDKWSPWFIGFALLHAAFTVVALTRKARWKQTE